MDGARRIPSLRAPFNSILVQKGESIYMERYEKELKKLINEQIERIKDVLAAGSPDDMMTYKLLVGHIVGLRQCIDLLDEARHNVNKSR